MSSQQKRPQAKAGTAVRLIKTLFSFYPVLLPAVIVCLLVAAGAVWLGVQVARYRRIRTREKAPHMGPILAARALAYAQGSILTGSLLTGVCAAIFGFHLTVAPARGLSALFWQVVVNLVCSVALLAAGLWAQHCCRIPPGEDEDDSPSGSVKPREGGTYAGS